MNFLNFTWKKEKFLPFLDGVLQICYFIYNTGGKIPYARKIYKARKPVKKSDRRK